MGAGVTPMLVVLAFLCLLGRDVGIRVPVRGRPPEVVAVLPSIGSVAGGVPVRVYGIGGRWKTEHTLQCKFGSIVVTAVLVGPDELLCVSPPHPEGFMSVEITRDGGEEFTADHVSFQYVSMRAVSVSPAVVPTGGGSQMTVHGSGFGEAVFCHFGRRRRPVPAHRVSSTAVVCEAPDLPTGSVVLSVSVDGETPLPTTQVPIEVVAPPTVASVELDFPGDDPVAVVAGSGYVASLDGTRCRLGTLGPLAARMLSPSQLLCPAGALLLLGRAGGGGGGAEVPVQVTVNMRDYSALAPAGAILPPPAAEVAMVAPARSLAGGGGGGGVTVVGARLPTGAACAFGSARRPAPLRVPAAFASSGTCVPPPSPPGFTAVTLLLQGGGGGALASHEFYFLDDPEVTHTHPTFGSAASGPPIVDVRGANLLEGVACLDGATGAELPAHRVSSALLRCEAPAGARGGGGWARLALGLSGGGAGGAVEAGRFRFLHRSASLPPAVHAVHPARGPSHGGTLASVHAVGVPDTPALSCWVGSTAPVAARWLGPGEVECALPARAPGAVPVGLRVGPGGQQNLPGSAAFTYVDPSRVVSSEPSHAGPEGGAEVRVSVEGGSAGAGGGGAVEVLVGGVSLAGSGLLLLGGAGGGGGVVVGAVPPARGAAGFVQVALADPAETAAGGVEFLYAEQPYLSGLYPEALWAGGGAHVLLAGANLPASGGGWPGGRLWCRFAGAAPVEARAVSSALASCEAPALREGRAPVSAGSAALGWAPAPARPAVLRAPLVSDLRPLRGPSEGGTVVVVEGAGLGSAGEPFCSFGTVTGVAGRLSGGTSSSLECVAPAAMPSGPRPVTVGHAAAGGAAQAAWGCTRCAFEHEASPALGGAPALASPDSGSAHGGRLVTIRGFGFLASSRAGSPAPSCELGGVPAAVAVSRPRGDGELVCVAPPAHAAGFVAVSVGGAPLRGVSFEYRRPAHVGAVRPRSGGTGGGTLLRVSGSDLVAPMGAWAGERAMPCTGVSSALLVCEAPGAPAGAVAVTAAPPGGEPSQEAPPAPGGGAGFTYRAPPSVHEITPYPMGPTSGGTLVGIGGAGFVDAARSNQVCRFGTVSVGARFVSPAEVECVAPAHQRGEVEVAVSTNLHDFVPSDVRYSFFDM